MNQIVITGGRVMHIWRLHRIAFSAVVLLLLLAGCEKGANDPDAPPGSSLAVESLFAINGDRSVTLGWTGVENGTAAALEIHRSPADGFSPAPHTLVASLPASATRYIDTALTNGTRYYYRIVPIEQTAAGERVQGKSHEATVGRPFNYAGLSAIVFSEHIQPIFQSGCAVHGCHAGESSAPAFSKSLDGGQFSLRAWTDLFQGSRNGAIMVPYRANMSNLIKHLNTDTLIAPVSEPHMPLPGFTLPAEQLQLLMRWIDEGAKDDGGTVAFSTYPDGRVMATNQSEDVISIIDMRTLLVSRFIRAGQARVVAPAVPQAPHNITVDSANGFYYVNLISAGKVLKYRLSDNAQVGEVAGILSPSQVALTLSGDTAFVAQFNDNARGAIRMVNTRTMTVYSRTVGDVLISKPHGVQMSPDGIHLVVTGNLSNNVFVLNMRTFAYQIVWLDPANPVPGTNIKPYQTTMTRDNKYVYVSCSGTNDVRVIDRDSLKVVKIIPVGANPLVPDVSPDDRFVYVPNRNSNSVSVIRTSDNTVTATIADAGPQPHAIVIDRTGRYGFLACENVSGAAAPHHPTSGSKAPGFINVIDLTTNTVIKSIEVGNFVAGIAVVY